ncbi:hypothetical protein [Streptantibioticus ferralitis]|uniref:hypothetical protein n=1 Tax=Streptantibioticus ferralitis TaxID=236510 RepID=UPI0023DAECDC|nr:hypothetical protein [Streptantibioticus ferralitis]
MALQNVARPANWAFGVSDDWLSAGYGWWQGQSGPYPERLREKSEGDLAVPRRRPVAGDAAGVRGVEHGFDRFESTVARAHHDAAGMGVREDVLAGLEEAADQAKGAMAGDGSRRLPGAATPIAVGPIAGASDDRLACWPGRSLSLGPRCFPGLACLGRTP